MKKGFTIIELLIVIGILAIMAAVIIPNVDRYIERVEQEQLELSK